MSRIGLCQVDGKLSNVALMKLSAWYKARGDSVDWFSPLKEYDKVYASKVFKFTSDNPYLPDGTERGGTGYNHDLLPPEIESMHPDYSLYPTNDYAIGFTTRGCIRRCPWCVVHEKEGDLKVIGDLYSFWAGQKTALVLDNNITAAPLRHLELIINQSLSEGVALDFTQGLDIRLINDDNAAILTRGKFVKQIHFAFDAMEYEPAVRRGIGILGKAGIKPARLMFYVLIGFNTTPEDDLYRVELLRSLKVDPFVMPFNKFDPYQKSFARWVNHKAIFKTVKWEDYKRGRARCC